MNANQNNKLRRTPMVQSVFAATVAVVAMAASGPSAAASHAVEGPGAPATTPQGRVTTACFDVPTPDRWPADVGAVPDCSHTYGGAN